MASEMKDNAGFHDKEFMKSLTHRQLSSRKENQNEKQGSLRGIYRNRERDIPALRSDTMKTALTMLMLCVSAVFAEDAIPPSDLNFGNLVFCITNGVSINAESSPQAESNVSKLSSALAHNGFTIAAGFPEAVFVRPVRYAPPSMGCLELIH